MKKLLVAALFILPGCVDKHVLINRSYTKDGFMVKGMHGRFEHLESEGVDKLTIGEGFEERTYTDRDHDRKPDAVLFQRETYQRTDSGTEEMFRRGDEDFEAAWDRYELKSVHEEWSGMSADERAERNRYFK